jgi:RNA polymerase sigma factor (sigma-70 family)
VRLNAIMCTESSETKEQRVPNLELAYPRLRTLFFAALGKLARNGFVVSPNDGMDLVHDFFAEAWAGLEKHFNPDKGNFESYAYGAFVRFARPRIVRLNRWQNSLIGAEKLESLTGDAGLAIEGMDQERVRQALANLPEGEQKILRRYVYSEYSSERVFAKELGISRYRLRAILIEALGRMAVSFDRPSEIAPQDWNVARALWRDCRTIQEASVVLEMTPQQVRSAYSRNVRFLAEILKHYQPDEWSPGRKKKMVERQQSNQALKLLKTVLQSPNDGSLLQDLGLHAEEILQALELTDDPTIEQSLDNLSPEWVASVYQALFEALAVKDLEAELAASEAWEAHEGEDMTIGRAFRETLLADLTDDLRFPPEFGSLPQIDENERVRLGRAPDVVGGKPESEWWLRYGIRPVTVFYALEAVSGLLNRYVRRGRLSETPVVLGDESLVVIGNDQKSYAVSNLLREEISCRADCSLEIASALYSWMLQVGQRKSWLFAGFEAEPGPGGSTLRLTCTKERFEKIYQRWGLTAGARYSAESKESAPQVSRAVSK